MWRWLLAGLFGINSAIAAPDWSKVPVKEIPLFYPGPAGLEWVMTKADHTGSHKIKTQNQSCFDCHEYDADKIGDDIVEGKKVGKARQVIDTKVPPGKRGSFPLKVQATHDETKLYLRFEWESSAPEGGPQADPANEIKLTVMFDTNQVEGSRLNGCWATCHMDLRTMPEASAKAKRHPKAKALGWNDGVTKYLAESRSGIEFDKKPRGGWNKLRSDQEIAAALKGGKFLDLMQYGSGNNGKAIDGYVLESRHMGGGKSLLNATGKRDGNKWVVSFERLLAAGGVGDHTIVPGQPLTFGFAIHENHSNARFHHVSLGYTLGLDDEASFFNAARQPGANAQTAPPSAPSTTPATPAPTAAPASESVNQN